MASVLPKPPVSFSTRGGLGFTMPPKPPARKKRFGGYCFRATCVVTDTVLGCPVGKAKGYDKNPSIAKDTEEVCKHHARMLGNKYTCGEAEIVMLPNLDMECSGQVFFVMDGNVKRLV